MEYFRTLYKNRKLILQLGLNNFKNQFAGTSLGVAWGFIQPFVFMFMYVIVFQYILKVGSAGDEPYIVWFLPGMSMWTFINDSILNGSSSITGFSYLVKKIVFPVDIIPTISFISSCIIGSFLFLISIIVCGLFGYYMDIFKFIYIIFAAFCLITALVRLTSAVCTLVPDFSQLLTVIMQLFFWFTPIIWNMTRLSASMQWVEKVVNCFPFTYVVNGFRSVFLNDGYFTMGNGVYTIIFWVVTILLFIWGNHVFKKSKKDFADVL